MLLGARNRQLLDTLVSKWFSGLRPMRHQTRLFFHYSFPLHESHNAHTQAILNTKFMHSNKLWFRFELVAAQFAHGMGTVHCVGHGHTVSKLNDQFKFPTYCNNRHGNVLWVSVMVRTAAKSKEKLKNKFCNGVRGVTAPPNYTCMRMRQQQKNKKVKRIAYANITF